MFGYINPFAINCYSAPYSYGSSFSMPFAKTNSFKFNISSIYTSARFTGVNSYTKLLENDRNNTTNTSFTHSNDSSYLTEPVFTQILDKTTLHSDASDDIQTTEQDKVSQKTTRTKNRTQNTKTEVARDKGALKETGFLEAVKGVAERLNCDYRDLLAVMNAECGLNPHVQNKKSKAIGLIQFIPKTARDLGTSTTALAKMSAVEQLVYVEKFLKQSKEKYGFANNARLSGVDLYCLVFLPARANRDVLCVAGERNKKGKLLKYYEGNVGVDLNQDGKITKAEMATRVENFRLKEVAIA